jgi:DnaJ-domain-containing protein 1
MLQKHPWFRKGLPENLEVDAYNAHYVNLSKQAADSADAIRRVVREALAEGHRRSGSDADFVHRDSLSTEGSIDDEYLSWY